MQNQSRQQRLLTGLTFVLIFGLWSVHGAFEYHDHDQATDHISHECDCSHVHFAFSLDSDFPTVSDWPDLASDPIPAMVYDVHRTNQRPDRSRAPPRI